MRVTVPIGSTQHPLDLEPAGERDGKRVWSARCRLPIDGVLRGGLVLVREAPSATAPNGTMRELREVEMSAEVPYLLEGYASSTSVDWHGTEMTQEALNGMALQMAAGVPYVPSHHDDEWEQVMGRTVEARVEQGTVVRDGGTGSQGDGYRLAVRVQLYPDHAKSQQLMQAVKRGQVVGMSIGGWFTDAEVVTNDADEVERIYIKAVELDHLAVTRRPSNPDSWIAGLARSTAQAYSAARATPKHALENAAMRAVDNLGGLVQRDVITVTVGEDEDEYAEGDVSEEGESCPVATQDIPTNLANRKHAIDRAGYGPANPDNPGDFWEKKAQAWQATVDEARTMVCGNCALFNTTTRMQDCIAQGIGGPDAAEVERVGAFGFCEAFDFKCSAKRTCSAWVVGGPYDDTKLAEAPTMNDDANEPEMEPMSEGGHRPDEQRASTAGAGKGTKGGKGGYGTGKPGGKGGKGGKRAMSDAPNYRLSNTTKQCGNCEYLTRDGWCSAFAFAAGADYTCDAWELAPAEDLAVGGNAGSAPYTDTPEDMMSVSGNVDLPLAPEDEAWGWDTDAANEVLGDPPDWERYGMAHLFVDDTAPEVRASYKLPFAKMVNGELHIVFRGVAAAMGALNGSRGGVDIPESDRPKVYERISTLYQRFDKEPPELRVGDTALDNGSPQGSTAESQSDAVESAALHQLPSKDNAMTDIRSTATETQRLDNLERAIGELNGVLSKLVERVAPSATPATAVADEATMLRSQLEAKDAQLSRALAAASRQGVAHSPNASRHTDIGGHAPLIRNVERAMGAGSALVQMARSQAERRDSTVLQTRAQLEADLRGLLTSAYADGIITDSFAVEA